jgi:hypothetical protein
MKNDPFYIWEKTFGKCCFCGTDIGTDTELIEPEIMFSCRSCADKKQGRSVSSFRDVVFGHKSRYNPDANFYFERLILHPDFFKSESAVFVAEFNPYI